MEHRALFVGGESAQEVEVEVNERAGGDLAIGHGRVGAEEAAVRSEGGEADVEHGADRGRRPVRIVGEGIGDLQPQVRQSRKARERGAPAGHALGRAVDRAAAVIKDEEQAGMGASEPLRVVGLMGIDHQVEGEPRVAHRAQAGAEGGLARDGGARREAQRRIGMPGQDVPEPGDAGMAGLLGDTLNRVGAREVHARDVAGGDDDPVEAVEPRGLPSRQVVGDAGLDMHGGGDPVARQSVSVIGGQPVAGERAGGLPLRRPVEPGMCARDPRPEVMMGVDDGPGPAGYRRASSRPETSSSPRISVPKMMLRQPAEASTIVMSADAVTSRSAPGMVPA